MDCRVCETRHWTGDLKQDGGEKQCFAVCSYTGVRCCLPALPDTRTKKGITISFHCRVHSGHCRFLYDTYKLNEKKISDSLASSSSTENKVDGAQLLYFILFDESKNHNEKLLKKLQQLDFKALNGLSVLIDKVIQFRRSHTNECFSKECQDQLHPGLIHKYEIFLVFLNNYLIELKRRRIASNVLGAPALESSSSSSSTIGLPVYGIMGGHRSPPNVSSSSSSKSRSSKKSKHKKPPRANVSSNGDDEKLDDILEEFKEIDRANLKFKPIISESKTERKNSTSTPIFVNPQTGAIETKAGNSVPFDIGKVSDLSELWKYAEKKFRGPGFIQLNPQFLMPVFPLDKLQLESRAISTSTSTRRIIVAADEPMSKKLKDATIKLITYPGSEFTNVFSELRESRKTIYSEKTLDFAKTIIDELTTTSRIFEEKFKVPIQSMIPIVWSAYSVKRQILFDALPNFIAKQVQDEIKSLIESQKPIN